MSKRTCNVCGVSKKISAFYEHPTGRGRRSAFCDECAQKKSRAFYRTPRGRAFHAWYRIRQRCRTNRHYTGVEIRMTKEEFITWAVPKFAEWEAERPHETPSVDREDPTGHYEITNIRLLPWGENARLARRNKNVHAPVGMAWCSKCKCHKPREEFHKSKTTANGFTNRCKACVSEYQKAYYELKRSR